MFDADRSNCILIDYAAFKEKRLPRSGNLCAIVDLSRMSFFAGKRQYIKNCSARQFVERCLTRDSENKASELSQQSKDAPCHI